MTNPATSDDPQSTAETAKHVVTGDIGDIKKSNLTLYLALAIIGFGWACTIPLIKIAVSTGHSPTGMIFWQLVVAVIMLGTVNLFRRRPIPLNAAALRYYFVIGMIGTVLPNSFSFVAAANLPAGVMGIVIATVPMFAFFIAILIRNEGFSLNRLIGIVLGCTAIMMIALPEASLPDRSKAIFVLVALLAPIMYGVEGNYIAWRNLTIIDPITTLLGASIIGAIVTLPATLAIGGFINPLAPWGGAEWALVGSSVFHALAYCGYIWLVGRAGAVFTSQIGYIVTIAAVFLSSIFLREQYSGWIWASLAIMMVGLFLVRPKRREIAEVLPPAP